MISLFKDETLMLEGQRDRSEFNEIIEFNGFFRNFKPTKTTFFDFTSYLGDSIRVPR